ncbi:uncharacterized protein K489DRAFT_414060 [Dissoconium aciculare CBS 342.82]|uniref:Uncharacterized protein n=1 Tax=Dissoconium aciculare CBS 342.82 TaxID=1314786 RepID=A0A6J3LTP8_9PEZI|nr:uncharacterized protein K489DRAFT_414060 [Dissoconium aciculare CBS 342.82]KAF1817997.1 hypothetical protein K489DRAFT_414060 [Dissoconium aciculare CBS 342.82]
MITQERFQHWFSNARKIFEPTSNNECNATLAEYRKAYASTSNHVDNNLGLYSSPTYATCREHVSCILDNTSEYSKATLSTGTALLGLMPLVLVALAPTTTELALVGMYRPGLGLILSAASPAVIVDRVFSWQDPGELLKLDHTAGDVRNPLIMNKRGKRASLVLGIIQYLLALGAVGNTAFLVIELSLNGVLNWGCTMTWPLYVWISLPVMFHIMACVGYYLTLDHSRNPDSTAYLQVSTCLPSIASASSLEPPVQTGDSGKRRPQSKRAGYEVREVGTSIASQTKSWGERLRLEFTSTVGQLNAHYPSRNWKAHNTEVRIGLLLCNLSGFLSFFHLIFAIISFSGLLFVTAIDAISDIGMRLALSALVSRLIVLVELGGLRGGLHKAEQ